MLLVFVHVPIVLAAILCFVVGMANPINVLLAHFRAFLRSRALEHVTPFAAGVSRGMQCMIEHAANGAQPCLLFGAVQVGNTFFLASPILVQVRQNGANIHQRIAVSHHVFFATTLTVHYSHSWAPFWKAEPGLQRHHKATTVQRWWCSQ